MSHDNPTSQKPDAQKPAPDMPGKNHGIELTEEELKDATGGTGATTSTLKATILVRKQGDQPQEY